MSRLSYKRKGIIQSMLVRHSVLVCARCVGYGENRLDTIRTKIIAIFCKDDHFEREKCLLSSPMYFIVFGHIIPDFAKVNRMGQRISLLLLSGAQAASDR